MSEIIVVSNDRTEMKFGRNSINGEVWSHVNIFEIIQKNYLNQKSTAVSFNSAGSF